MRSGFSDAVEGAVGARLAWISVLDEPLARLSVALAHQSPDEFVAAVRLALRADRSFFDPPAHAFHALLVVFAGDGAFSVLADALPLLERIRDPPLRPEDLLNFDPALSALVDDAARIAALAQVPLLSLSAFDALNKAFRLRRPDAPATTPSMDRAARIAFARSLLHRGRTRSHLLKQAVTFLLREGLRDHVPPGEVIRPLLDAQRVDAALRFARGAPAAERALVQELAARDTPLGTLKRVLDDVQLSAAEFPQIRARAERSAISFLAHQENPDLLVRFVVTAESPEERERRARLISSVAATSATDPRAPSASSSASARARYTGRSHHARSAAKAGRVSHDVLGLIRGGWDADEGFRTVARRRIEARRAEAALKSSLSATAAATTTKARSGSVGSASPPSNDPFRDEVAAALRDDDDDDDDDDSGDMENGGEADDRKDKNELNAVGVKSAAPATPSLRSASARVERPSPDPSPSSPRVIDGSLEDPLWCEVSEYGGLRLPSAVDVSVVDSVEAVRTLAVHLASRPDPVALDAEWKPVTSPFDQPRCSILTLACGSRVVLVDLLRLDDLTRLDHHSHHHPHHPSPSSESADTIDSTARATEASCGGVRGGDPQAEARAAVEALFRALFAAHRTAVLAFGGASDFAVLRRTFPWLPEHVLPGSDGSHGSATVVDLDPSSSTWTDRARQNLAERLLRPRGADQASDEDGRDSDTTASDVTPRDRPDTDASDDDRDHDQDQDGDEADEGASAVGRSSRPDASDRPRPPALHARLPRSLSAMCERVLPEAHPLDKFWTMSDWDRRPLLREQVEYAALDAFVLLRLHAQLAPLLADASSPARRRARHRRESPAKPASANTEPGVTESER